MRYSFRRVLSREKGNFAKITRGKVPIGRQSFAARDLNVVRYNRAAIINEIYLFNYKHSVLVIGIVILGTVALILDK